MKISLFTPFYAPQSHAAAVRCYWLARTLRDASHEVEVLTSINTSESKKLIFIPADNKQSFAIRLFFEILCGIELFIRILISKNDLIILSSPPFITISIAHLACRLKGARYLLDIRDIYPDVYFAQGLINESSIVGQRVKEFTKSMYENAYGITSVTPGLIEKIKKRAPKSRRVELVLNGYDQEMFKPSSVKNEKFTVVFHGNMGKVQNIPTILEVAKILEEQRDIEFIFIGEGPQAELLKETKLENVKYLGAKEYKEIPSLIAKAHMGFSARRDDDIGSDAFPVKVFEYLGVGIPSIVTPRSGAVSKLAPEAIFEFQNDETKKIAAKILELKNTQSTFKLTQDFSRQEVSKKILNLCDF